MCLCFPWFIPHSTCTCDQPKNQTIRPGCMVNKVLIPPWILQVKERPSVPGSCQVLDPIFRSCSRLALLPADVAVLAALLIADTNGCQSFRKLIRKIEIRRDHDFPR